MILSDREIKKYIDSGNLKIDGMENPDVQIQPSGVDLRLGNEFRVFKVISVPYIDPKHPIENYTELIRIEDNQPFVIHPGEFVLASVKEYIKIPDELVGLIDGRSSLGRLGISVHTTSAGINPGWEGILALEVANIGKMPIALYPGMRVAKLTLAKLTSPPERPYGKRGDEKYHKQEGSEESKIFKDFRWK
ncbi:MAG: dCTP deaminase [Candidatus Aenigmarchaeota archaeon]|nr:dCTP deaminase [Candidatus Aenigmarchaeota archaeon]